MYSPKEGEEWEGGWEEKLLLLEGNKNTECSMCWTWGRGAELHCGPWDRCHTLCRWWGCCSKNHRL